MEKVRPWCGQASGRGRLKNRTEQNEQSEGRETFDAQSGGSVGGSGIGGRAASVLGRVVRTRRVEDQLTQPVRVPLPVARHLAAVLEPVDLRVLRVAVQPALKREPRYTHTPI